jgi:hypothetical protein
MRIAIDTRARILSISAVISTDEAEEIREPIFRTDDNLQLDILVYCRQEFTAFLA